MMKVAKLRVAFWAGKDEASCMPGLYWKNWGLYLLFRYIFLYLYGIFDKTIVSYIETFRKL